MVQKNELFSVDTHGMRWVYFRVTDEFDRLLHYNIVFAGHPAYCPSIDDLLKILEV